MGYLEDYKSRFDGIFTAALQHTGALKKPQALHLKAVADHAVYNEKVKFRKEISERWKERFKIAKEENDSLEKDLEAAYKWALSEIVDYYQSMLGEEV
jgi:hypothetical protein